LKKGDSVRIATNTDGKITEVTATQENDADADDDSDYPRILESLSLTQEQKDKIKDICQECSEHRKAAWKQFANHYHEAIAIEASMLASIEDNLSDSQRKHLREHRHRIAQAHRHAAKGKSKSNDNATRDNKKDSEDRNSDRNDNAAAIEELTIIGVTLSPDQEVAAEGVRETYYSRLRKLNREIETLHSRLVAMETDRLIKIEDVLTKEQRETLRKEHQKMSHSAKSASNKSGSSR